MKKKLTIVKIGGKVINEEEQLDAFLKKFVKLEGDKLLVHGGGNIATKMQEELGIPVTMVEGRRVTDKDAIEIVTMVFSGLNKKITAKLQSLDLQSVGLSGADFGHIVSKRRNPTPVDYGYVGDIQNVDISLLKVLFDREICPVLCALTHDGKGQLLNTNADTIASEVAKAMSEAYEVDLVYCFEQPGVLSDFENKVVISEIDKATYQDLKTDGTINAGMIPKLDNAFTAIDAGVGAVKICHFDEVDTLQSENYSGTTIC
ncbi:MAG: acetylglutamate kinase [Reichenbachiella sp.]